MTVWHGADAVRITRDVQRVYDLGPRPIFELLSELAGDPIARLDIEICLERYARLTPELIDSVGGRELRPPLAVVENDAATTTPSAHPVRGAAA